MNFFEKLGQKIKELGIGGSDGAEPMGVEGCVVYSLRDRFGNLKARGQFHNLVTSIGDMFLAQFVAMANTSNPQSFYATLGVNTTAPLKADTALGTALTSSRGVTAAYPQRVTSFGTGAGEWTVWQFDWAAGVTTNGSIGEVGMSTGPGSFLAHATLSPNVNKGASDTLQVQWGWKFLGA